MFKVAKFCNHVKASNKSADETKKKYLEKIKTLKEKIKK